MALGMAMVNRHSCIGVVVALLAVLFALGVVGVRASVGEGDVMNDDVAMVTLELSRYLTQERRKLASATVWCVAKANLSDAALQGALDWVCGPMPDQGQVNCGPLQSGGACYLPDTVSSHTSWAFNAYFQSRNASDAACDFQGTGTQVTTDPSLSTCIYPGTVKELNGTVTSNGTVTPPAPPGFSQNGAAEPQFNLFIELSAAMIMFSVAYLLN